MILLTKIRMISNLKHNESVFLAEQKKKMKNYKRQKKSPQKFERKLRRTSPVQQTTNGSLKLRGKN